MTCALKYVDKSGWRRGPWDDEDDLVFWSAGDVPCLMLRNDMGVWCGYVAVPVDHPWAHVELACDMTLMVQAIAGVDDPAPYLDVHWGVTFQGPMPSLATRFDDVDEFPPILATLGPSMHWIGWDYGHADDLMPAHPILSDLGGVYHLQANVQAEVEKAAGLVAAVGAVR